METAPQPYAGIRIVDLTRELGSYCTRLFADLGAEVIRVEPPGGAADRGCPPLASGIGSAQFEFLNINKKSVTLDTSTDSGRAVLRDLVAAAPIVAWEHGAAVELSEVVAVPGRRVV